MAKTWPSKDPDEVLDFRYDWTLDLAENETLDSHEFIVVEAAGINVADEVLETPYFDAWLTGGNDGETAIFTHRVTTSDNRTFEDTILLPIRSTVVPDMHPGGYVEPTAAHLIAAFPEFADVPKATIDNYLRRAARSVDDSWLEGDFADARMLLAAHLMTISGVGASAEAKAVSNGFAGFKSIKSGSLSLERADGGKGGAGFDASRYGQQFKSLLRRNKGGPRVTNAVAIGGGGDGDHFGPWTQ